LDYQFFIYYMILNRISDRVLRSRAVTLGDSEWLVAYTDHNYKVRLLLWLLSRNGTGNQNAKK
jgi:hypothetical protein